MMDPHPDWSDTALPREADLGAYRLAPLAMDRTEEDFAAVTQSADDLRGLFGDWPDGLTIHENRVDLAWHDREFTTKRSFSWIVRDGAGAYLGCFYVSPDIGTRGSAEVSLWLRSMPDRDQTARAVRTAVETWLGPYCPDGVQLRWQTSPT